MLSAVVVWIALRAFDLDRHLIVMSAVLATTSALSIFAFFLMPDFIMGLAALAMAVLAARWSALVAWQRLVLAGVICCAALFHLGNAMVLLVSAAATLLASVLPVPQAASLRRGTTLALTAIAVGIGGLLAYPIAVGLVTGSPLYSPPFVAARVIADGPGRTYLRQHCGRGAQSEWCRFAQQPMTDNNEILWSKDPKSGAFQLADYESRVALIKDEPRFLLAVVSFDPYSIVHALVGNVSTLLLEFGVREVLHDSDKVWTDPQFSVFSTLVPGTEDCTMGNISCASRLHHRYVDRVIGATILLSIALIAWSMCNRRLRTEWGALLAIVALALITNAVIFGTLSGTAQRYQSRMMWLLPFLALCLLLRKTSDRFLTARAQPM